MFFKNCYKKLFFKIVFEDSYDPNLLTSQESMFWKDLGGIIAGVVW